MLGLGLLASHHVGSQGNGLRTPVAICRLSTVGPFCPGKQLLHRRKGAPLPALITRIQATAPAAAPAPGNDSSSSSGSPGPWQQFAAVASALTNLFPVWVLGAAVWALLQPPAFAWFDNSYITPALAVTMLGMGLTLTFEDFKRVLTTPGRIFAGFALQYTIMPLLGFVVSKLSGLPLDFVIGLCLVASCPGGTASNVVTYLAKADVTLSVLMTTASTLGAVVATPLLSKLLLRTLVPVDAVGLLVSTLQVVLLPVLAGAALNQAFPAAVALLSPLCALSAAVLIALICGSVVAQNAAAVLQAGPTLLASIFALHAGGFFFGYVFSRVLGMPERAARTNSIEVGMQNSTLGALLASRHFAAHPLAAVPCAISACMHSVLGSLLAAWWRGQPTGEEVPASEEQQPATAAEAAAASKLGAAPKGDSGLIAAPSDSGSASEAEVAVESVARLAQAPPAVQDFIARWGQREGVDAAAQAEQQPEWVAAMAAQDAVVAPAAAVEAPAPAPAPAAAAATVATAAASKAEAGGEVEVPAQVQAFIDRWGKREGIEAAYEDSQAAGAATAAGKEQPLAEVKPVSAAAEPDPVQALFGRPGAPPEQPPPEGIQRAAARSSLSGLLLGAGPEAVESSAGEST